MLLRSAALAGCPFYKAGCDEIDSLDQFPTNSGPIFKCGVGACTPLFIKPLLLEGEGGAKNAFALSSFVSRKTNAIANA